MKSAALMANACIISVRSHVFEPHGFSCVVIVQDSNLSIHTWPEYGYAAAKFFTYGPELHPQESFEYLKEYLQAKNSTCKELNLGSS